MTANIGMIDRTVRLILGSILLVISLVVDLVTTGAGKIIVSVIGVILVATGLVRY